MLNSAVIVFRECLEAALIIGIIAAATRGLPGRARWIVGSVMAGVAGSVLVALGADEIAIY
jgi:high-affinity iron transporter